LALALALACGGSKDERAPSGPVGADASGTAGEPMAAAAAPAAPQGSGLPPSGIQGINIDPEATSAVNILTSHNGVHPVAMSTAKTRLLSPGWRHELMTLGRGAAFIVPKADEMPWAVTYELPQTYRLDRVGVKIGRTFHPYRLPKLLVEVSTEGPDLGFANLVEIPLEEAESVEQTVGVPRTDARWVRYTFPEAVKKQLDAAPAELDVPDLYGFYAYGRRVQDLAAAAVDVTGTWRTWDTREGASEAVACFEQKGAAVDGVLITGGSRWFLEYQGVVEGRLLMVQTKPLVDTWVNSYPLTQGGLVIDAEGDYMMGVVPRFASQPLEPSESRPWWFEKTSGDIHCQGFGSAAQAADAKSKVEQDLEAGRAKVYGILFDFDRDTIKVAESKPVLDEVVEVMKKHPDWRFSLEGHTDSVGKDDYNLDLSNRRAAAVVRWLSENGIEASRLESVGKGETAPTASNETVPGRALNRRVEIVRL
jgi:outer membrane protein OmpA-like peptidoglycan-associated protein